MRDIFIVFCVFLFQIQTFSLTMSEEPKVTGRDVWRYLNHFDHQEYKEQHEQFVLSKKNDESAIQTSKQSHEQHYLEQMAEYLQIPKSENIKHATVLMGTILINSRDIKGYFFNGSRPLAVSQTESVFGPTTFAIDPGQWSEKLDYPLVVNEQNEIGSGGIHVHVECFRSYEEARIRLIGMITAGNMQPAYYLTLYKIEKGPGDVCLVHLYNSLLTSPLIRPTGPPTLSDNRVAFIRGNVAVYMQSSYKDFGCMDLACRLDAFLVEQMKKQQEKENPKSE